MVASRWGLGLTSLVLLDCRTAQQESWLGHGLLWPSAYRRVA